MSISLPQKFHVAVDYSKALDLMKRSAELGYLKSCAYLALYHRDGIGCQVNMRAHLRWLRCAAVLGEPRSMERVHMYYENGLQEWFEYDASQKRVWSWKASSYWMENGNPEMDSMLLDLPKSGARMLYGREHLIYS